MNRIRSITPTICELAQIPRPALSFCEPLSIVEIARQQFATREACSAMRHGIRCTPTCRLARGDRCSEGIKYRHYFSRSER